MSRTLNVYKSYSFKTKDPIIDQVRTLIQDEGTKYKKIEEQSGVSVSTITNWLTGPTLRPQHATVMAVIRSLGYDMQIVQGGGARAAKRRGARANGATVMHHRAAAFRS